MILIENSSDFSKLSDGNTIVGSPAFNNSKVRFWGKNNILYCENGITLNNSIIDFNGSNSLIYLGSTRYKKYSLGVYINNNQVFYMGKNNYINDNGKLTVVLSEEKHVYIGNECLLSTEIIIRNADPHLIYDVNTNKRTNETKSIFIGDHVWVGQRAVLLKGTQIDSGSIIGAMSVVANKKIPHNTSWAGNPAKQIGKDIFWNGNVVHTWTKNDTDLSKDWEKYKKNKNLNEDWVYHYEADKSISFDEIDKDLSECHTSKDKLNYLLNFDKTYNKYAHLDI